MRTWAKNLLVILLLVMFVLYVARRFPEMQKGTDFADFYAAARMVRDGAGSKLYDPAQQDRYLKRYSGRVGTYFIHPPFETLIYLPFALLPIAHAYTFWCCLNAALLMLVTRMLAKLVPLPWDWRILLPLSLLFVPLLLNFLQGQDALLLLFFWTAAFVAFGQKHEFIAGCLLACGLIKFHLTLPVAIPFMFTSPKKVLEGFVSGAIVLLLLSARICGWEMVSTYPRFLEQLGSLPLAGIHHQQMANLRGLFGTALDHSPELALILVLLSSILVLCFTVHSGMLAIGAGSRTKLLVANAVLAATLVGYHLSPHDLTLLLLPIALIVHHLLTVNAVPAATRVFLLLASGLLFLPPLQLLLLRAHVYTYACLPILLLFALTHTEIRRIADVGANLRQC